RVQHRLAVAGPRARRGTPRGRHAPDTRVRIAKRSPCGLPEGASLRREVGDVLVVGLLLRPLGLAPGQDLGQHLFEPRFLLLELGQETPVGGAALGGAVEVGPQPGLLSRTERYSAFRAVTSRRSAARALRCCSTFRRASFTLAPVSSPSSSCLSRESSAAATVVVWSAVRSST